MFIFSLFLFSLIWQTPMVLQERAIVDTVVDGDTIKVHINGKQENIRFIGINTPEIAHFGQPTQCYGKEAQTHLKTLLKKGDTVFLEADKTQDNRDKYDRLLRYVFVDNLLLNKEILENGFGKEYTYKIPYLHQKEFKEAQKKAKQSQQGLWRFCE